MQKAGPGEITALLQAWSTGDRSALDRLVPLVYRELRRLASTHLRGERPDHTLQPAGLVHEAYLRLVGQSRAALGSRAQFFAAASNLMRQILINHAERRRAAKRGGATITVMIDAAGLSQQACVDLLALERALQKLARLDPRQSRIVELRFFGGLTEVEIGTVLGISPNTVKREWRAAKALLHRDLADGHPPGWLEGARAAPAELS